MTRDKELESLISRLQYAAIRSEKIANNPIVHVTPTDQLDAHMRPVHHYSYLCISEDVALSHNNNAVLMHKVIAFLKTVNESEKQMRERILREITEHLQGNPSGEKL